MHKPAVKQVRHAKLLCHTQQEYNLLGQNGAQSWRTAMMGQHHHMQTTTDKTFLTCAAVKEFEGPT